MSPEAYNVKIVFILTIGFSLAAFLGYLTHRAKLSPLLGYLVAGYLIGPFSPGFVADLQVSEQLAEIGVILMLFGVGLHFKWQDLASVKNIAIPGAIGQTLSALLVGTIVILYAGWSLSAAIIVGMAIGVASTIVLVRQLTENRLLDTPQGHIAVGWLIVEDLFTVIVLIMLPSFANQSPETTISWQHAAGSLLFALLKFLILALVMFTVGKRLVAYALTKIARTHSQELFTLAILALTFLITIGSSIIFGTSNALGAFIAGMVIGQTEVRHQALANSLPIKDAFSVIFFLTIGMLFNPAILVEHYYLIFAILSIILIVKPLSAFTIVSCMRYPFIVALTVALALAQIGEFSFILAEQASKLKLLPDEGYDLIVACALISISLNPLFFKLTKSFKLHEGKLPEEHSAHGRVLIIGFGEHGKSAANLVESCGYEPMLIDFDIDAFSPDIKDKHDTLFGNGTALHILEAANIETTKLLIIAVPDPAVAMKIIRSARELNPDLPIFVHGKSDDTLAISNRIVFCENMEIDRCRGVLERFIKNLS